MRITRAIKNRIVSGHGGVDDRLVLPVCINVFFMVRWCIPLRNPVPGAWLLIVLGICAACAWWIGRIYARMVIATLILTLAIVLTFGFVGAQQTSEGIVYGGNSNDVNIRLTQQEETQSELLYVTAVMPGAYWNEFSTEDKVVLKYRTVSLFGLRLWTAIDSVDSVPVMGAGSRNVVASDAWYPILVGVTPLVLLVGIFFFRRRYSVAVTSDEAKSGDEVHKSTAPGI